MGGINPLKIRPVRKFTKVIWYFAEPLQPGNGPLADATARIVATRRKTKPLRTDILLRNVIFVMKDWEWR